MGKGNAFETADTKIPGGALLLFSKSRFPFQIPLSSLPYAYTIKQGCAILKNKIFYHGKIHQ